MSTLAKKCPRPRSRRCRLHSPGWTDSTRAALERLITEGANRHLPVVFDFDNTLVCGDIGEATLAVLAHTGVLTPGTVPKALCPPFRPGGKRLIQIESCADVTEYYEALLNPTAQGSADQQPLTTGYAWATQVMESLKLSEVVTATRTAFHWSDPAKPGIVEVTPGRTGYPAPFFYPEMIELLSELLRHGFDLWIVSASNVWSVRWMVSYVLNPLLREQGTPTRVRADHVIGISTLLQDRDHRLYKDTVLVRQNADYARLESSILGRFRLTSQLQTPVPTYSGKIAVIFDRIGRNPYLAVGDSPGDLPMLALSPHRLWIARLDKPKYQKVVAAWIRKTGSHGWLIQPTLPARDKGFQREPG